LRTTTSFHPFQTVSSDSGLLPALAFALDVLVELHNGLLEAEAAGARVRAVRLAHGTAILRVDDWEIRRIEWSGKDALRRELKQN
jgi:hypothetical protein